MKIFVLNDIEKYFIDDDGQVLIHEKPVFSFEYDTIFYSNTLARKNETQILSQSEMNEIDEFIIEYKKNNKHAFCVDDNGNYLGYIEYIPNVNNKVPYAPFDSSFVWSFGKNDWRKKYYYDDRGKHVTNESQSSGYTFKVPPSDIHVFSEDKDAWTLNDVATYENKLITKIKTIATLLYYMDFAYGNQAFLKEIVSNIKTKAIVDGKSDLIDLCNYTLELIDNCDTAKDKLELERQLNESLMLINQKVMVDTTETVFLQTDTWKSISNI